MYRNVLIPLDGSSFAERILAHIERIVSPEETDLILLRVIEPHDVLVAPEAIPSMETIDLTRTQEQVEQYLRQVKGELRQMGFRAHTQIVKGDVASNICDVADAQEADLIAMTTHGRSGMSRWAFGSIADRVIRTANQPVFVVRGATEVPSNGQLQRILVPLDGSELAERALSQAKTLAQEKGAEILLVRALEPLSDREYAGIFASWESPTEVYAHRHTAAERYLEEVQADLREAGISSETVIEEGYPAEVILDAEEMEGVDVIVMSTHGRSGLARWVYGSVADKVLRRAESPLLLIRAIPEGEGVEP